MTWLIACRALQGIGGCLSQLSFIIISDIVPLEEYAYRAQAGPFPDPTNDLVVEDVIVAYLAPRMVSRGIHFTRFRASGFLTLF